jgi:hypothetical protein
LFILNYCYHYSSQDSTKLSTTLLQLKIHLFCFSIANGVLTQRFPGTIKQFPSDGISSGAGYETMFYLRDLEWQFYGKRCPRTRFDTGKAIPAICCIPYRSFSTLFQKKITRANFFATSLRSSWASIAELAVDSDGHNSFPSSAEI